MTRFARTNQATQKKTCGHDPTPWNQMGLSISAESSIHTTEKTNLKKKKKIKKITNIEEITLNISPKKKKKKRRSDAPPAGTSVAEKLTNKDNEGQEKDNELPEKKKKSQKQDDLASRVRAKVEEVKEKVGTLSAYEEQELTEYYKKELRRENRRLKRIDERESERVCFHCRESGHDISNCPRASKDQDSGAGICFKCGSTEHMLQQCRIKLPQGEFPYAKCFICNEMGHLSKQCPDNPRGLYPNGGCCNECGSVEHFRKDCPELQKKRGEEQIVISRIKPSNTMSVDAEESLIVSKPKPLVKGPKIVKF